MAIDLSSKVARRGERSRNLPVAVFVAPFTALFLFTVVVPVGYALWRSFYRDARSGLGFGGTERVFVGLENYVRTLTDSGFTTSLLNVLIYAAIYIPIMLGSALAVALLLDTAHAKLKHFFRFAIFMPYAVPALFASIVWIYLYTPQVSPVVSWLETVGISWNFFGNNAAILSIVNIQAWQWIGYNAILFFAALQAIPREVLEAARVDGAGAFRTGLTIKVPMIRPTVGLLSLFTVIGAIQLFDAAMLMQSRASSITTDWTPVMFIIKAAFGSLDYGLAAAASVVLAVIVGVLSYAVTKFANARR